MDKIIRIINIKKMKSLITLIIAMISLSLSAQTIERQVIGSTGGTATGGGIVMTSTLGEVAVSTSSTASIVQTQGYQQAIDSNSVSIAEIENTAKMKLYPNPTTNSAKLEITANFNSATTIAVYSIDGKLISSNSLALTSGIESSIQIDVSNQASGIYMIRIIGEDNSFLETMRLVKQ